MKTLTPIKQRFVEAFVRYNNASKDIRLAYPEQSKHWSQSYIGTKAHRLMNNDDIKAEISNRKSIMEQNANLGTARIQKIITEGKEHNALTASMFAIEQVDGKAQQTTHVESKHVSVVYNLGGEGVPEIPLEVLRQLED